MKVIDLKLLQNSFPLPVLTKKVIDLKLLQNSFPLPVLTKNESLHLPFQMERIGNHQIPFGNQA